MKNFSESAAYNNSVSGKKIVVVVSAALRIKSQKGNFTFHSNVEVGIYKIFSWKALHISAR